MARNGPTRRQYLLTAGAGAATLLAGCGGDSESTPTGTETSDPAVSPTESDDSTPEPTETPGDELPEDTNPDDGYPPEFDDQPESMDYSASNWGTHSEVVEDMAYEIPIVPLEVAYNLYARREARFIDARVEAGYEVSHVLGAVRSLPGQTSGSDPTSDWNTSDPVIIYCHCPYHNAFRRAAQLRYAGFENVYALANGYQAWKVADHPTAGGGVPSSATTWTIEGESNASEGEVAYVYHNESDQVAGTTVESDGSFTLEFAFASIAGSDTVTVGTPGNKVSGSLVSFTSGTVSTGGGTPTGTATGTPANGTATSTDDGGFGTETPSNGTASNGTATETDDSTFGRIVGGRFL